jgi:hypothetical protein
MILLMFALVVFQWGANGPVREALGRGCLEEESYFGIVAHPGTPDWEEPERTVALLKELGVGWVRMHMSWKEIEPLKGSFNESSWEIYDSLVQRLIDEKIRVMGFISGVPEWAASPLDKNRSGGTHPKPSPGDPEDLANFLGMAMKRYGGKIRYWQLLNETSNQNHWIEPERLVEIFRAIHNRAKAGNSDVCIVAPGLSTNGAGKKAYFERFVKAGGTNVVDVVDFHMYKWLSIITRDIPKIKEIMTLNHTEKPIQFSELGVASEFHPSEKWWNNQLPKMEGPWDWPEGTPQTQAEQLVKRLVLSLSLGVGRIYWSRTRDKVNMDSGGGKRIKSNRWKTASGYAWSKGIIDGDYNPKPSFYAYMNLIHRVDRSNYVGRLDLGPMIEAHFFQRHNAIVGVLWTKEGARAIKLRLQGANISLEDQMGRPMGRPDSAGFLTVALTSAPVYLTGLSRLPCVVQ